MADVLPPIQTSVRAATLGDLSDILKINSQSTPGVARLSDDEVAGILDASPCVRVAMTGSQVVGYVIAYPSDSSYGGEEFTWVRDRYETFLYVDQVAVASGLRGAGLGAQLYRDVEQWARARRIPLLACEVNLRPANPGSLRFHRRHGYHPVQHLETGDGRKVVMMLKTLRT
jgi:predicted GNAT superfamily acetyltransferase